MFMYEFQLQPHASHAPLWFLTQFAIFFFFFALCMIIKTSHHQDYSDTEGGRGGGAVDLTLQSSCIYSPLIKHLFGHKQ